MHKICLPKWLPDSVHWTSWLQKVNQEFNFRLQRALSGHIISELNLLSCHMPCHVLRSFISPSKHDESTGAVMFCNEVASSLLHDLLLGTAWRLGEICGPCPSKGSKVRTINAWFWHGLLVASTLWKHSSERNQIRRQSWGWVIFLCMGHMSERCEQKLIIYLQRL